MTKMYFFGCVDRAGHYLWDSELRTGCVRSPSKYPEIPWEGYIDAVFAPRVPDKYGYPNGSEAPQGVCSFLQKDGWTMIAFWDRTGDSRSNSNSAFIAEGTHTFEEMKELAKEQFPTIVSRFEFELVLAN